MGWHNKQREQLGNDIHGEAAGRLQRFRYFAFSDGLTLAIGAGETMKMQTQAKYGFTLGIAMQKTGSNEAQISMEKQQVTAVASPSTCLKMEKH